MDFSIPPGLTPAAMEAFLQIQLELIRRQEPVRLVPAPQSGLVHPTVPPPHLPLLPLALALPLAPSSPPRVLAVASPEPVKESREPLLRGVMKIMSTKEAIALIKNPTSFTSNLLDMHMAASGTVWLYKSQKTTDTGDWRHVGHQ